MNSKTSISKKELELHFEIFFILNSNSFFLQINDYIKTNCKVNALINLHLTKLLFTKSNLFDNISNFNKKAYSICFNSIVTTNKQVFYNDKRSIFFNSVVQSLIFRINHNYYQYNTHFFDFFKPLNVVYTWNFFLN